MGAAWMQSSGASLPIIFPGQAEQRAAYRLLSNDGVTMEHILDSHTEQTVERCGAEQLVLAIQDTTTLNYAGLVATQGLDDIGSGNWGLRMHVGITVNAAGRPLGLFMTNADLRQAEGKDSRRWVLGLERAGELARACPRTRVINVCDREGDFWQLLAHADRAGQELLVRTPSHHEDMGGVQCRVVLPDGGDADLRDHVLRSEPVGLRTITVPARGGLHKRKERVAKLTVRCLPVTLLPPGDFSTDPPVSMLAVSACEETPPASVRGRAGRRGGPLRWILLMLSDDAGPGAADPDCATAVLDWYALHWKIEHFFSTLKQGTCIEGRRLDQADDLRKCFAFDAITVFRIWDLSC